MNNETKWAGQANCATVQDKNGCDKPLPSPARSIVEVGGGVQEVILYHVERITIHHGGKHFTRTATDWHHLAELGLENYYAIIDQQKERLIALSVENAELRRLLRHHSDDIDARRSEMKKLIEQNDMLHSKIRLARAELRAIEPS